MRGKHENEPEGVTRPNAGDEPREFTSRGEGEHAPPSLRRYFFSLFSIYNRPDAFLVEYPGSAGAIN
ncbi:hypothetical protein AUK22_06105 [bacterium CG2_30_54_10]|nr:MAG: hypothetical protein AUK22_06105 [bacterium CG2_30_54_10]